MSDIAVSLTSGTTLAGVPNVWPAIHYWTCMSFTLMGRLLWRMNIWLRIIRLSDGVASMYACCTRVDRLGDILDVESCRRHEVKSG